MGSQYPNLAVPFVLGTSVKGTPLMGIRYKLFIDMIMSVKGLFWWINKFTLYFVSREIAICSSKIFYSNLKTGIDKRTIYWKPCKDEEFYKKYVMCNW